MDGWMDGVGANGDSDVVEVNKILVSRFFIPDGNKMCRTGNTKQSNDFMYVYRLS